MLHIIMFNNALNSNQIKGGINLINFYFFNTFLIFANHFILGMCLMKTLIILIHLYLSTQNVKYF